VNADEALSAAQRFLDEDADNPYRAVMDNMLNNPEQELWIVWYVSSLTGEAPDGGGVVVPWDGPVRDFTSELDAEEYFGVIWPDDYYEDEESLSEAATPTADEEDFFQSIATKGATS